MSVPRLLLVVVGFTAALATATAAFAGDAEWSAGEIDLPVLTAYASEVEAAIGKKLVGAPAWRPGVEVGVLVTATEGGSRAAAVAHELDAEDLAEFEAWTRRWVLPVGEPGIEMPVRVWWEKPRKGEKKEKVKKGEKPTQPTVGLRFAVGWSARVSGGLAAEEILRAERLVFSTQSACPDEVGQLGRTAVAVTVWHLDIAADGAVVATPQDLYVPPPDPKTREGRAALAEMEAAEAPAAPEGAPEGPKVEKPKFELPGAPKVESPVEVPEKEEEEEEVEEVLPPREWTAMELCVAARLAEARVKVSEGIEPTLVDDFPVVVRQRR